MINNTNADTLREVVLYQDETARVSHRQLFTLDSSCYYALQTNIIDSILKVIQDDLIKLHIAAGWEAVLKVALWTPEKPATHDALLLLRKYGVSEEEISPFRKSDINDIFPWLYYGKKFDILRRICNAAKSKAEAKINKKNFLVYCHLVSHDTCRIAASSL